MPLPSPLRSSARRPTGFRSVELREIEVETPRLGNGERVHRQPANQFAPAVAEPLATQQAQRRRRALGACSGIVCVACCCCLAVLAGVVVGIVMLVPVIRCGLSPGECDEASSTPAPTPPVATLETFETTLPLEYAPFLATFGLGADGSCVASPSCASFCVGSVAAAHGVAADRVTLLGVSAGSVVLRYNIYCDPHSALELPTSAAWAESPFFSSFFERSADGEVESKRTSSAPMRGAAPTAAPTPPTPGPTLAPTLDAAGETEVFRDAVAQGALATSKSEAELKKTRPFTLASLDDLKQSAVRFLKGKVLDGQRDKIEAAVHDLGVAGRVNETMAQLAPELEAFALGFADDFVASLGSAEMRETLATILDSVVAPGGYIEKLSSEMFPSDEGGCGGGRRRAGESFPGDVEGDAIGAAIMRMLQPLVDSCVSGKGSCEDAAGNTYNANPVFGIAASATLGVDKTLYATGSGSRSDGSRGTKIKGNVGIGIGASYRKAWQNDQTDNAFLLSLTAPEIGVSRASMPSYQHYCETDVRLFIRNCPSDGCPFYSTRAFDNAGAPCSIANVDVLIPMTESFRVEGEWPYKACYGGNGGSCADLKLEDEAQIRRCIGPKLGTCIYDFLDDYYDYNEDDDEADARFVFVRSGVPLPSGEGGKDTAATPPRGKPSKDGKVTSFMKRHELDSVLSVGITAQFSAQFNPYYTNGFTVGVSFDGIPYLPLLRGIELYFDGTLDSSGRFKRPLCEDLSIPPIPYSVHQDGISIIECSASTFTPCPLGFGIRLADLTFFSDEASSNFNIMESIQSIKKMIKSLRSTADDDDDGVDLKKALPTGISLSWDHDWVVRAEGTDGKRGKFLAGSDNCPAARRRQLFAWSDSMAAVVDPVLNYLSSGVASAPFCLGEDDMAECTDPTLYVFGNLTVLPNTCAKTELSARVGLLTIGALAALVTDRKHPEMLDLLGPVKSFGIRDAEASIAVTDQYVEIKASGSPALGGGDSVFQKSIDFFIADAVESLTFALHARLTFGGLAADVECTVAFPTTKNDAGFSMTTALFVGGEVGQLVSSNARVGVRGTFLVEVESGSSPKTIGFVGEAYASLMATSGAVVANADLKQAGTEPWWNALGTNYVHLSDMTLGLGIDATTGFFPPKPVRFEVGASACFGSKESCQSGTGDYVRASAFVGLDATNPSNAYAVVFVTELTFGKVAAVLADVGVITGQYRDAVGQMPKILAEAGIYPFDTTHCGGGDAAVANVTSKGSIAKDCFSYLTVSPARARTLELSGGDIDVPQGFSVAGNLRAGRLDVRLKAGISRTRFAVNGSMAPLDFELLQLGGELNSRNVAVGRPKVEMDFSIGSAYTHILCAFSIPILKSYGAVSVDLNDAGFSFDAELELLGGALTADAHVAWDWGLEEVDILLSIGTVFSFLTVGGVGDKTAPAVAKWNKALGTLTVSAQVWTFGFTASVEFGIAPDPPVVVVTRASCSAAAPCGDGQGGCSSDDDCAAGLTCFKRRRDLCDARCWGSYAQAKANATLFRTRTCLDSWCLLPYGYDDAEFGASKDLDFCIDESAEKHQPIVVANQEVRPGGWYGRVGYEGFMGLFAGEVAVVFSPEGKSPGFAAEINARISFSNFFAKIGNGLNGIADSLTREVDRREAAEKSSSGGWANKIQEGANFVLDLCFSIFGDGAPMCTAISGAIDDLAGVFGVIVDFVESLKDDCMSAVRSATAAVARFLADAIDSLVGFEIFEGQAMLRLSLETYTLPSISRPCVRFPGGGSTGSCGPKVVHTRDRWVLMYSLDLTLFGQNMRPYGYLIWNSETNALETFADDLWASIRQSWNFRSLLTDFVDGVSGLGEKITDAWGQAKIAVVDFFEGVWGKIAGKFKELLDDAVDFIKDVAGTVSSAVDAAYQAARDKLNAAADGLINAFGSLGFLSGKRKEICSLAERRKAEADAAYFAKKNELIALAAEFGTEPSEEEQRQLDAVEGERAALMANVNEARQELVSCTQRSKSEAEVLAEQLGLAVSDLMGDMSDKFEEWARDLEVTIQDLGKQLKDIFDELANIAKAAADAIADAARKAKDAVKKIFKGW